MPSKYAKFFQIPWRTRSAIARDVDTELSFHIEMRVAELQAQGLALDEARRRAREEFGDLEFTRQYCRREDERAERATRAIDSVADWRQDVSYALRTLRRSPGFAAVTLLTLALAIGANSAIFSVARAVLLKPLPYGNPERLVALFEGWSGKPDAGTQLSPPNYVDYRAQQQSFTDVGAFAGQGALPWHLDGNDPEMLWAASVTTNLFGVLRVAPMIGRAFTPNDEIPGNEFKVIVSYEFWERSLGANRSVIGQPISLNGRRYELVGVMPRGFSLGLHEDAWTPLEFHDELADAARTRKQHWVHGIGRLKPGTTMATAGADLLTISKRLESQYPDADAGRIAMLVPLHESMTGDLRKPLALLQGAALLVLLIACANLANLTLSRTIGRRREMALRAALGAGRARLVRQLLTESVLLSTLGGALGVGLAIVATRALLAMNPDALPQMFAVTTDVRVLLFSLAISVVTGMLFGVLPAMDAARANLHHSLKESGRGSSGGQGGERVRRALVVAQVGLAVMLLVGAGLLIRSFGELARVRLGFDPDHVLVAQIRAAGERYDSSAAVNRFYDGVIGELSHTPGIVAAAATNNVPTSYGRVSSSLRVEGEPVDERHLPDIGYISVRGDYFKALRIPLIAGRLYDASDLPDGPSTVLINETAALRFFPKGDAIGRRIHIGPNPTGPGMTVIGVVGDIHDEGSSVATKPTLFANHRQETWERSLSLVVRTDGDPLTAASALRRAVKTADPSLALRDIRTLDAVVGASLARRRFAVALASCFAVVALLLAAVGIYGVLAYMVTTRRREFGVRLALGATTRDVLLLVVRQGLSWSMLGLVLGVVGALAAGRLLAGLLFGVTPLDLSTYAAVVAGLLVVVAAACLIPGARATRVDPLESMRAE